MNRYVDALATLASKIHISEENQNINMLVIKRTMPCPTSELFQPSNYKIVSQIHISSSIIELDIREMNPTSIASLNYYLTECYVYSCSSNTYLLAIYCRRLILSGTSWIKCA